MRAPNVVSVQRAAMRAAHELLAPLVVGRALGVARARVPATMALRAARYVAVVEARCPVMHVAGASRVKRSRVRLGVSQIEDLRDRPEWDRLITNLSNEVLAC